MRYIKDIPHEFYKISLYRWNEKYIIKFEAGGRYEQVYKVDETDITSEDELDRIVDGAMIAAVRKRFDEMHADWQATLLRNEIIF